MERRALIICSPGKRRTPDFLRGAIVDARAWNDFFQSPRGGAWEADEIKTLRNPTADEVDSALIAIEREADFAAVLFSGHGYHPRPRRWDEMSSRVVLNEDEDLNVTDLFPDVDKGIVVIDACRELTRPERRREPRLEISGLAGFPDYESYRQAFDDAVASCASQLNVAFGCSVGELAGDSSSRGGYFTHSLLCEAQEWSPRDVPRYLPFAVAVDRARESVRDRFPDARQHPRRNGSRWADASLPIAVEIVERRRGHRVVTLG